MKTRQLFFLFSSFLIFLFPSGCSHKSVGSALQPSTKFALPVKPARFNLPNGITVLYLKNDELPLVQGTLYLKGGSLGESKDCPGCIAALGTLLRSGGAGGLSPDELDRTLEKLSASISTSFGVEYGSISFQSLSQDVEKVLSIVSDIIKRPRFDESRISLLKAQLLESIRRRRDDADTVTGISLSQLLFGDSPLGRVVTSSDVASISRSKLMSLHERLLKPEGAILAISGDIEEEEVRKLAAAYIGKWSGGKGSPLIPITSLTEPTADPGIYFIELPFVQSTVLVGQRGVPRLTPDRYAIEIFNNIFGESSLNSSLAEKVRTESGNAYVVYGAIIPGPIQGRNIIGLQTKSDSVGKALGEALGVLEDFQRNEQKHPRIKEAIGAVLNSFIFRFDTPAKTVQRAAVLEFLNYPTDYDATYSERIAGITPADILEVAVKRWKLDDLIIVVAGDANAYAALEECVQLGCGSLRKGTPLRKVTFYEKLKW